jgi:MFS family permease
MGDAPPLPPPPGSPAWQAPTSLQGRPFAPPGSIIDRPAWRQGRPGWALLHLAIGIGLAIAGFFMIGIAIAIGGRTETDLDRADDGLSALAFFVLIFACLVGWLCFAYLPGTAGRRWIALASAASAGWLLALILMLQATR